MPSTEGQAPPLASGNRRPHFFKVLVGDFKKRLKIPPNFCKHIPWEASRKGKSASMATTLEGPSGRTWPVGLRRTAEGTFFTSGWAKFVQDQALRELEFLVFRYDGDNRRFTAMVFDKTACEREDLLEPRPGKKRNAKRSKKDSVGKELVPYRAPSEQLQVAVKTEVDAMVKTRSIQDDLAGIPASIQRYKGYVSRRRAVTSAERQRAMELAHAFRSSLPYCVVRMSTMHVYYSFMLRFPTGFSRQHLPRERTEVALRVEPGGEAWAVLYIPSARDRLSRGWCAFARGNCLEEGDYCVFELVAAAEFRVHIFRVVEPPVPAVRLPRT